MKNDVYIKLSYVPGLQEIVKSEMTNFDIVPIENPDENSLYLSYEDEISAIKELKTISRAYLAVQDKSYHPLYLLKHKSIVGDLIREILEKNPPKSFESFSISCAGSDSSEIKKIKKYISEEFNLVEALEADLKIYIAKIRDTWEVSAQITPRPLSTREYRINNILGAMDATIAHSLNYLCNLDDCKSYLNVFSGSGTLIIEAALKNKNLEKIVGFDNDKKHLSASIQNIKKAGLIKKVIIHESDIFDNPDFGKFDVITSDLPFGMVISKGENLESLYKKFIEYCESHLNEDGRIAVYTSEFRIFEDLINESRLNIAREIKINLITNEKQFLPVKILILAFDK